MAQLETGLPSVRQIQTMIKDKKQVEVKLINNDSVEGKISWQDSDCLCLMDDDKRPTIVWRQAIAYLKPKP
jgi:host factor-I protein